MTNDLYLNGEKPSLNLKNNIELTFPLTFCIRFNLKGQLLHSFPIFMDKDTKFGLILRFTVGLGKVFLNEESLMFIIPQEYQIQPYAWHHLCVTVTENIQKVVADGKIWFHEKHNKSFKKISIKEFFSGSESELKYSDISYFIGEVSEFNIWGNTLPIEDLKRITIDCETPMPLPDILNWSEITPSMLSGDIYQKDIKQVCSSGMDSQLMYKVMPYFKNQGDAMHTCKILQSQLSYPKSIEDYKKWEGKYQGPLKKLNLLYFTFKGMSFFQHLSL